MKVLMLGRIGLLKNGGGDLVQIKNTAKELEKLGVQVDIKTGFNFDATKYDLIHIFQLDFNSENYFYTKIAKKHNKPLVLSPIHHNYNQVKLFDDTYAFDFRRISKVLFKNQFNRDVFKNIYRSFFDYKKIVPSLYSVFLGLKNMHKYTLKNSDYVLVQTSNEIKDLQNVYNLDIPNYKIVVNGVGEHFINYKDSKNNFAFDDYIVCVGRIEPRKNQLNIIKAVELLRKDLDKDIKLVFIGKCNSLNHFEYTSKFYKQLKKHKWINHIKQVPYSKMPSYYHFAKVCVSASWFETTGLTSLEALYCNTNAVASGEEAKEYLKDKASYCEPNNIDSIYNAIKKEYFAKRPKLSDNIKYNYTWKKAAEQTYKVYKSLLNK